MNFLIISKLYRSERLHVVFKLSCVLRSKSYLMTNKVKLLKESSCYTVKPRVIFVSKPVITLEVKYAVSLFDKRCIVYKFNCSCDKINIGKTTRYFKIKIKKFFSQVCQKSYDRQNFSKTRAVINIAKRQVANI